MIDQTFNYEKAERKTANIQHVLTYITCAHAHIRERKRETEEKEGGSKKFMNSGKAEKRKRERETEEKEGRVEEVLEKNGIAVKFRL